MTDSSIRSHLDFRAYFITGVEEPCALIDRVRAAVAGGVGVIQLRSKPITPRNMFHLGWKVAEAVADTNTTVLIDDYVDVAAALRHRGVNIAGVHVGQEDLPVAQVRALLGPEAVIGLTTGTRELVEQANDLAEYLDYIGCGPFRRTPTKNSGRHPIGLAGYPPLVKASTLPVIAIGDVQAEDVTDLAATGIAGVAIVRGFMNTDNPTRYAQNVLTAFERGRPQ